MIINRRSNARRVSVHLQASGGEMFVTPAANHTSLGSPEASSSAPADHYRFQVALLVFSLSPCTSVGLSGAPSETSVMYCWILVYWWTWLQRRDGDVGRG